MRGLVRAFWQRRWHGVAASELTRLLKQGEIACAFRTAQDHEHELAVAFREAFRHPSEAASCVNALTSNVAIRAAASNCDAGETDLGFSCSLEGTRQMTRFVAGIYSRADSLALANRDHFCKWLQHAHVGASTVFAILAAGAVATPADAAFLLQATVAILKNFHVTAEDKSEAVELALTNISLGHFLRYVFTSTQFRFTLTVRAGLPFEGPENRLKWLRGDSFSNVFSRFLPQRTLGARARVKLADDILTNAHSHGVSLNEKHWALRVGVLTACPPTNEDAHEEAKDLVDRLTQKGLMSSNILLAYMAFLAQRGLVTEAMDATRDFAQYDFSGKSSTRIVDKLSLYDRHDVCEVNDLSILPVDRENVVLLRYVCDAFSQCVEQDSVRKECGSRVAAQLLGRRLRAALHTHMLALGGSEARALIPCLLRIDAAVSLITPATAPTLSPLMQRVFAIQEFGPPSRASVSQLLLSLCSRCVVSPSDVLPELFTALEVALKTHTVPNNAIGDLPRYRIEELRVWQEVACVRVADALSLAVTRSAQAAARLADDARGYGSTEKNDMMPTTTPQKLREAARFSPAETVARSHRLLQIHQLVQSPSDDSAIGNRQIDLVKATVVRAVQTAMTRADVTARDVAGATAFLCTLELPALSLVSRVLAVEITEGKEAIAASSMLPEASLSAYLENRDMPTTDLSHVSPSLHAQLLTLGKRPHDKRSDFFAGVLRDHIEGRVTGASFTSLPS
ncbi:MAG: hypothetical protein MHM6MM_006133 [Cercozoa sp. M6MM]